MRMRRHTESPFAGLLAGPWRRFARDIGLVTLTFGLGYAASVYYISPGSVTTDDHAIPRVLGRSAEEAEAALANAGFRSRVEGERSSPSVRRGGIVWQDPPPDMVAPPNAVVQLVISSGPAPVTVPDVVGLALPYAEKVVEARRDPGRPRGHGAERGRRGGGRHRHTTRRRATVGHGGPLSIWS